MTFHVGQKVCCVGLDEKLPLSDLARGAANVPELKGVYTIRSIFYWRDITLLRLCEIDNAHMIAIMRCGVEPGFNALGFRPIVENKSSISFTHGADPSTDKLDNRRKVKERA